MTSATQCCSRHTQPTCRCTRQHGFPRMPKQGSSKRRLQRICSSHPASCKSVNSELTSRVHNSQLNCIVSSGATAAAATVLVFNHCSSGRPAATCTAPAALTGLCILPGRCSWRALQRLASSWWPQLQWGSYQTQLHCQHWSWPR
jgi:hypothetical protein